MNVRLILTTNLLLLLLAACDATPAYDPNIAALNAQATVERARLDIRQTAQAIEDANATATISAAETQQASAAEIALLNKQIEAVNAGVHATQTLDARAQATQEAEETARAAPTQTAMAGTQTAIPAGATATAIYYIAQNEAVKANLKAIALLIVVGGIVGIFFIIGYVIITWINARSRKYWITITPNGLVIALVPGDNGRIEPRVLAQQGVIDGRIRDIPPTAPKSKPPPTPPDDERLRMVLKLVQDSIQVAGQNTDRLPGWRRLPGWTSGPWQHAKAPLEAAGVVYSKPDEGTFIRDGDLGNLLYELQTGKIRLSPIRK